MIEAELHPDDIDTDDIIKFFKLMVVMLNIADQMREDGDLIPVEHINTILIVNEFMFALMAAFCPAMLEAPAGYWGSDDDNFEEGDDDETF